MRDSGGVRPSSRASDTGTGRQRGPTTTTATGIAERGGGGRKVGIARELARAVSPFHALLRGAHRNPRCVRPRENGGERAGGRGEESGDGGDRGGEGRGVRRGGGDGIEWRARRGKLARACGRRSVSAGEGEKERVRWRRRRRRVGGGGGKAYLGKCRRRSRSRFSVLAGTCYRHVAPSYTSLRGAPRWKVHDRGCGHGGGGGDDGEATNTHTDGPA